MTQPLALPPAADRCDVLWFLPTHGDGRYLGSVEGARHVTIGYLSQIARAADELGYFGVLLPTGRSVVDALRRRLPEIWPALAVEQRRRVLRLLLPFSEVHRFRISPQAHAAVARRLARRSLTIDRVKLISLDARRRPRSESARA